MENTPTNKFRFAANIKASRDRYEKLLGRIPTSAELAELIDIPAETIDAMAGTMLELEEMISQIPAHILIDDDNTESERSGSSSNNTENLSEMRRKGFVDQLRAYKTHLESQLQREATPEELVLHTGTSAEVIDTFRDDLWKE